MRFIQAFRIACACITIALGMLLTNVAYETIGSVPDLEGAGFLAGSLTGLSIFFTVWCSLVVHRMVSGRRSLDLNICGSSNVTGFKIGLTGSLIYLIPGAAMANHRVALTGQAENMWVAVAVLALLSGMGGSLGSHLGLRRLQHIAGLAKQ